MKAYVVTTGTIFGLIVLAHLLRIAAEGSHVARDPVFILLTILAGSLSYWAWRVFHALRDPSRVGR